MAQFKTWNSTLWNQHVWNGGADLDALPTSDEDISFRGFGLQNEQIVTSRVDTWSANPREVTTSNVPNGDGAIINSDFYRTKTLELEGMLHGVTESGLDQLIFDFKKNLSFQGGNLDIRLGDNTIRRFICTNVEVFVDRIDHYRINSCPFRIQFECYDPFGQDENYTSNNFEVTVLNFEEEISNPGNAPSFPVFLLVLEANNQDATQISITSQTTGQKIQISGTYVPGDVIIFDGENKEVTVNTAQVEFTGSFPEIQPGANSVLVNMTATQADYEFTWKVLGKYL